MAELESGSLNPDTPGSPSPSRPHHASNLQPVSPSQGVRKIMINADSPDRLLGRNSPGKRSVRVAAASSEPRRPTHPFNLPEGPKRPRMPSGSSGFTSFTSGTSSLGAFSDEYDLSHEDPQILQDVQKALKLKARREARIKSGRPAHLPKTISSSPSSSGVSSPPRPTVYQIPSIATTQPQPPITNSEVDFGPSTAANSIPLHPVPSSVDHGTTLDWGGDVSDDERPDKRWSLSIPKRKGKEKAENMSSAYLKKGEDEYKSKIESIRNSVTSNTLKKARITGSQLERRYKLIYDRLDSISTRLNPLQISRWLDNQDPLTKGNLEHAEPFTWLKHLEKRRTYKDGLRFPWHLSALVMEEYYHSQRYQHLMETIPEDASSSPQGFIPQIIPPIITNDSPTPLPLDGPLEGSARNSLDVDSRRSGESIYSAISGSANPTIPPPPISPTASLSHLRGMSSRLRARIPGSEDGYSIRHSISERSDDAGKDVIMPGAKRRRPMDINLIADRIAQGNSSLKYVSSKEPSEAGDGPTPSSAAVANRVVAGVIPYTGAEPPGLVATRMAAAPMLTALPHRKPRVSAASSQRVKAEREMEKDEEKLQEEYDQKLRLLDELNSQNTRIRQTLNRIATTVREHDTLQASFMHMLEAPHVGIPQDALDAFGHDPAAVIGSTRRLRSWRAVEDIHSRVLRQRDVLRRFIYGAEEKTPGPLGSVLEEPITSLTRALETISAQHEEIIVKAYEVAKVLKSVKALHADVKSEYNDTLAHTSVVYPELSYIVALEESYKDQYQQIWEFGMDALTFLLDHVAPFWRTYGKTIGEDIQDFLIIPLYRNEFTGEPKRYPIKRIPRRSFRHWTGFFLFFVISCAICILQCRAAITSSRHYRLQIIAHSGIRWFLVPFFWISIIIQWSAFLVELCMVLMQLAIATWWIGWIVRVVD